MAFVYLHPMTAILPQFTNAQPIDLVMNNITLYLNGIQKNRKYINQSLIYLMNNTPKKQVTNKLKEQITELENALLDKELYHELVRLKKVKEAVCRFVEIPA